MKKKKTTRLSPNAKLRKVIAELELMLHQKQNDCRQREVTIQTLANRLRTVEGERNAMRQVARFSRVSQMDVGMLNSRMETIAALLQQSTKMIEELKEPDEHDQHLEVLQGMVEGAKSATAAQIDSQVEQAWRRAGGGGAPRRVPHPSP